jgi:hypothetical protein
LASAHPREKVRSFSFRPRRSNTVSTGRPKRVSGMAGDVGTSLRRLVRARLRRRLARRAEPGEAGMLRWRRRCRTRCLHSRGHPLAFEDQPCPTRRSWAGDARRRQEPARRSRTPRKRRCAGRAAEEPSRSGPRGLHKWSSVPSAARRGRCEASTGRSVANGRCPSPWAGRGRREAPTRPTATPLAVGPTTRPRRRGACYRPSVSRLSQGCGT